MNSEKIFAEFDASLHLGNWFEQLSNSTEDKVFTDVMNNLSVKMEQLDTFMAKQTTEHTKDITTIYSEIKTTTHTNIHAYSKEYQVELGEAAEKLKQKNILDFFQQEKLEEDIQKDVEDILGDALSE